MPCMLLNNYVCLMNLEPRVIADVHFILGYSIERNHLKMIAFCQNCEIL